MLSQDMRENPIKLSTPADTSLNLAIRTLWTEALTSIFHPMLNSPLTVIRHDFLVKDNDGQRLSENSYSNT